MTVNLWIYGMTYEDPETTIQLRFQKPISYQTQIQKLSNLSAIAIQKRNVIIQYSDSKL